MRHQRFDIRRFAGETEGAMTLFAVFFLVIFLMVGGMAVDFMRHEERRVRVQHTLDRAVLAAADLDQTISRNGQAKGIVVNYFAKAGLAGIVEREDITASIALNCRDVAVSIAPELPTYFLGLVDIDSIPVNASARARECVSDVEVSLVLDVSGSMASNDRLTNLQDAAKKFVTELLGGTMDDEGNITPNDDADEDRVSISIVPFATHVNVGADFAADLDGLTNEHAFSNCVRFSESDYTTREIHPSNLTDDAGAVTQAATTLQREGHFNPATYRWKGADKDGNAATMDPYDFECQTGADRYITPWSVDPQELADHIDSFVANGWTSMEIGMKWGVALLDPAMQPALADRVTAGTADDDLDGRPFAYERSETLKVIVIMSDGENTEQWELNDAYMGSSLVHLDEDDPGPADDEYSVYYGIWSDGDEYWWHEDRQGDGPWRTHEDQDNSGETTTALTYHELFDRMSVEAWSDRIYQEYWDDNVAYDGRPGYWDGYNDTYSAVVSGTKDARLKTICAAARAKGIVIFTIAFEAPSAGDVALKDCATSDAHFFDADGLEISEAFSAIESQINKLRLVR